MREAKTDIYEFLGVRKSQFVVDLLHDGFFLCLHFYGAENRISNSYSIHDNTRRGSWLDIPSEGLTPDGTLDGAEGELDEEPKPPKMPDIISRPDSD